MATNEEFTPYAWDDLAERWEREEITLEQLSGQLLVWSRDLHKMLVTCQREQEGIMHSLADLEARMRGLEEGS